MSYGNSCLVDDSIINYCSNIVYNTAPKTFTLLRTNEEKVDSNVCCFYDGYPMKNNVIGLPKKRNADGSFSVWGYFCSYECARAFVNENQCSCNQSKEISLLALMGIKTFGIHFRLNNAPSKFLLQKFGGPLDIEEWRKENLSTRLWVVRTPNTERTCMAYECYLNHASSKTKYDKKPKVQEESNKDIQISKRVTPAHFTKKSLLSLFNKN